MTMFRADKYRTPLRAVTGQPSHVAGVQNYKRTLLSDTGSYFSIGNYSIPVYVEKYGYIEKYYGIHNSYTRTDSSTIIVRAENINDILSTVDVTIQYPQNGQWAEERTFGVNWSPNTAVKVVKRVRIVVNGRTHAYVLTIPVQSAFIKPTLVFITNPEKIKINSFSDGGYLSGTGRFGNVEAIIYGNGTSPKVYFKYNGSEYTIN